MIKQVLVDFYNNYNDNDTILSVRTFMHINYSNIISAINTFPDLKKEFIDRYEEVDLQVAAGDNDEYDELIVANVLKLISKIINVI